MKKRMYKCKAILEENFLLLLLVICVGIGAALLLWDCSIKKCLTLIQTVDTAYEEFRQDVDPVFECYGGRNEE
ncbi:MAG: hypothetical protein ACOYBL_09635 [Lachnospiraceae bacterium]|jgi:hypothetical protein